MNKLFLGIFLMAIFVPVVNAEVDMISFDVDHGLTATIKSFFGELAIGFDETQYAPGETARATIVSTVPCNTKYVTITLNKDGQNFYYRDVSDKFYGCTSSYVQATFTTPDEEGEYEFGIQFRDGSGNVIHTDRAYLLVFTEQQACQQSYCDEWKDVQQYENYVIQQQTCYVVNQDTCAVQPWEETRILCDEGHVEVDGRCVLESGEAVCGNGVVEAGESCDVGFSNGVCPSTCNSFCQVSTCEDLPGDDPNTPATQDPVESESNGLIIVSGAIAALGLALISRRYFL